MKNDTKIPRDVPGTSRTIPFKVITYYRNDYVNKDGKSPVNLVVHLQGKKVRFNTGIFIPPESWDVEKLEVRKIEPSYRDYNLIIKNCRSRILDIFVRYRLQHRELSPDILKKEYVKPSISIDFLKFMEDAIEERKGEITDSSLAQHRAHLNKLREFRPTLAFSELTSDLFVEYQRWLKNKKTNGQNTRWNSLKTIRTYINIAKRKKLIEENPLDKMPVTRAHTARDFLSEEELKALVKLYRSDYLPDNYKRVLRHYLFACFTGIRISDLIRIKMEDIIQGTLVLMPYKTQNVNARTVKIPLNDIAQELIDDESPYRLFGNVFAPFSEPRMRTYLKDILQVAKIKRPMSFHSSRHTFATQFLRKTKNLAALQKLLGHGRIDQTMVYAHVLTEDLEDEMKLFNDF